MLHNQIQHAWPHLLESEGNVIMTSTRVCLKPTESWTCYASTKSVLNYLCSCLPLEEPRIRALALSPGAVDTGAMVKARDDREMETIFMLSALLTSMQPICPQRCRSS